jgi:hypothetical protein
LLVMHRAASPGRTLRWAAWLSACALVLPALTLLPYLRSGTELARARNALVYVAAPQSAFDWTPDTQPADFLRDAAAPDPYFTDIVRRLRLDVLPSDWDRAVAIAVHLLASSPKLSGGAIQADLRETHRRIVDRGDGYCADFVRVFQALAVAAGIPVRAWAFSFDGFGGHGHVWPEIWNRQAGAWQLLDVFDNYQFSDGAGPLSALQLRQALLAKSPTLRLHPLAPGARPGFVHEPKAWSYFQAGLDEWYLWWGNNPFTYEQAASVRWLSPVSRSLAQLGAIVQGVQPPPRLLASADNTPQIKALQRVRFHLNAVLLLGIAGLAGLATTLALRRSRRSTGALHVA